MSGAYKYLLGAGDLQAEFLPGAGMLGASLTLAGTELLRRVENLEAARVKGSTAGDSAAVSVGESAERLAISCGWARGVAGFVLGTLAF